MGDGLLWMIFQRILIIADNNLHKLKLQIENGPGENMSVLTNMTIL